MNRIATSGFTLVELLVVITILGVVATVALPLLSSNDPQKLSVAAEETANTLRFALSEAKRTSGYVLVDGKTTSGRIKLYHSTSNANLTTAIIDPLTKRTLDLNMTSRVFSQGVTLTPKFIQGSVSYSQLLIGPGLSQLQVFDGIPNKGPLQANSGVLLTLGSQGVTVRINEVTGLVTLP